MQAQVEEGREQLNRVKKVPTLAHSNVEGVHLAYSVVPKYIIVINTNLITTMMKSAVSFEEEIVVK